MEDQESVIESKHDVVFVNTSEKRGDEEDKDKDDSAPWRVYAAHSLSTWGDNMWWFAGGVFMLHLQEDNLRLTAIYGLIIAASVIVFGASLGRWIDRTKRLTAAKTFLLVQNTCVSLCALLLSGFIGYKHLVPADHALSSLIAVTISAIILASVARLASSGVNIIIQKDWIVVIANNDTDKLAKMNSVLRTIELTTYMLAPAAGGLLFTYIGFVGTGVFMGVWNIVSVVLEYLLLISIYRQHPRLGECRTHVDEDTAEDDNDDNALTSAVAGWKTYFTHPVRNAGLGLSFLYMTVLGFDNITYGYCILQGVSHFALGVLVGVSALVGVLGSLAYPPIRSRIGLERTGLLGMLLLISTSSLAVLSVFLPGSPMDLEAWMRNDNMTEAYNDNNSTDDTSAIIDESNEFLMKYGSVSVFLLGIILARFGLWIVDLTINQIIQEKVEEDKRGVFNGVQDSLNNSLDLLKCILVIFLPDQQTFGLLILLSFVSINTGWLLYALYSRSQRGHLFHFCQLVNVILPDSPNSIRKPENSKIVGTKEELDSMVKNYEDSLQV